MATEGFPLKGYTLPLTPKGAASLVESPPWYYGGEVMQLVFRTAEEKARELVPPPLEMGPEPGKGIVWFVEWVSVSESNPDLVFTNPERTVYQECVIMLQCSFRGEPGYIVPYIWVDNDFTLMRGFVQGFPKKLARICRTKLNELNPRVGGRRPGARLKGICESHGERLVEGSLTLTRPADSSELPAVRFYLMRHFPDIEDPSRPAVHELAVSQVADVAVADVWAGDADVRFFRSDVEELDALAPVETQGGFFHGMGFSIKGGRVIHRYR
ncbi:MAG: acetoacetate decarboxylase family protein [Dehalococcoidia bacterium]|nr:acetoacetate decarboxylase family protein [Dehalococcoidia bacterium]